MWLNPAELTTHLRNEQLSAIARDDETIITAAIDGAIAEAKGYLAAFDTEQIFSTSGPQRHQLLLIFIKDIAVYHFINLCNVGTQYEIRKLRYERAVDWLKDVQKGMARPDLPAKEDPQGNLTPVKYGSNPKRTQHF